MAMKFTTSDVSNIAALAHIPLSSGEEQTLAYGFTTTMEVVDELGKVDVTNIEPTHQVTGKENAFREDVIDEARMFTQEQALANAPRTHDGFFVVDQVIEQE